MRSAHGHALDVDRIPAITLLLAVPFAVKLQLHFPRWIDKRFFSSDRTPASPLRGSVK
ncbi:MAG: hypothetical protein PHO08_20260 [Methylococcales bacterium]|nr:hypothetical protein [Methylococcales bacterium]